jgi:hypothetical protein
MKPNKLFKLGMILIFAFSLLGTLPMNAAWAAPNNATSPAPLNAAYNCASVTEIPQAECEALVALYNSTNGAGWTTNTNWLITDTPCTWYRVFCSSGHVTSLNLAPNQLSGSIPPEVGNLTQLTTLRLSENQLTGSIPAEVGNLIQLTALILWGNQLTGAIPVGLGGLTQLTDLELEQNLLSGSVPAQLGNLTQLTILSLDANQLSGTIPAELGNLTKLTYLALDSNQLSGTIPVELGNLTQLTFLSLYQNQLSGSIPAALGNLTQLTEFKLHNNQLSGEFPASITNLVNLTTLTFDCGLTSSDPAVIAFLNNLVPGWQGACLTISGTVRDESGAPITGTTITVTAESPDGQVVYNSADSNPADGTYTINNLPLDTNMMITVYGNEVYGAEYYEEAVFRSLATVFNLTEATPTYSNIDFTLPSSRPIPYFEQLTFNVRAGGILNDLIIRKAIAYGTDRERMLNKALLENGDMYGVVLNSLVAPGYWSQPAYNQVNIYPYDSAQANAILDAAGIIDNNNNGIRETVSGGDIVLDFKTTDGAFRAASSAIFVENMAAIGIQVNVTLVPFDVFFSNDPAISPLAAGDFDIAEFAWGSYDQNLDDLYAWQVYQTGNYQNFGGYANATVDAEFSAAMAATDRASMLPHVLAYYAEITEDMPSLPLFTRGAVTPVSTISGTNVLADLSSVGVRVTFQNATSGGRTAAYASAIHPNDLPLNNTRVAVYEIGSSVTMATSTGATVCVNYDDSALTSAEENKLQLHHLTMTGTRQWINIFTSRNTTTNQVCGFTNSFSTFAVLLPNAEPPAAFNKFSPANGVTNQPTSLSLAWGISTGATSYEYCYDTSNNNTCNSTWKSNGTNKSVNIKALANNTKYYWQVRAINVAGTTYANNGTWWAFTTKPLVTKTFYSTASQDGWMLESTEISNVGGTMDSTAATISLGDNNQKKQYRSILSFSTASLPDDATITKVTLKLKHSSVAPAGTNPITLLQGIYVDIRKGFFGDSASLQLTDFNAPVSKTVGPFKPVLTTGWYTISLNSTTFASINKLASNGGLTQFRLRFKLDDNSDTIANYLSLFSGNAPAASRPQLLIEYYVP